MTILKGTSIENLMRKIELGQNIRSNQRVFLEYLSQDVRCELDHKLIGSTVPKATNPRIPYAILAGANVEDVNKKRQRLEIGSKVGLNLAVGLHFDLPKLHHAWYHLDPADPITFEVPWPRIAIVQDIVTGKEISDPEALKNITYKGSYLKMSGFLSRTRKVYNPFE